MSNATKENIDLGDKVKDIVTGFVRIAVARPIYIDGYINITVKNGYLDFNEKQLEVLSKNYLVL